MNVNERSKYITKMKGKKKTTKKTCLDILTV